MTKEFNIFALQQQAKQEYSQVSKIFKKTFLEGNYVKGKYVEKLEKDITKYTKNKYCVTLNSGTDALMLSLWSLGIKKGDEVITSPISFIATAASISHLGAKPVFVDVDYDLNINPNLIEKSITNKTKAILVVHWTGRVCKMDQIQIIAKKYNLKIIEDAAQAMGSYYNETHAGNFSDVAAFSAHPLKNFNSIGDSGFITTNNYKIYKSIKNYSNHGLINRNDAELFGVNSRLDSIYAGILSFRLKNLKKVISKRRKNVEYYKMYLNKKFIKLPLYNPKEYHAFTIFNCFCYNRNKLFKYLNSNKIQSLIYYSKPLHLQKPSLKYGYKKGDFPIAEKLCNSILSFPCHEFLNQKDILFISKKINQFYEK